MTEFLQTLVSSISIGSLYALIALGYTLVYGILKFINFAHSDVVVLGAWVGFSVARAAGWGVDAAETSGATLGWVVAFGLGVGGFGATGVLLGRRLARPSGRTALQTRALYAAGCALGAAAGAAAGWALGRVVSGALGGVESVYVRGPLVIVVAMGTCGAAGYLIERFAYRPLRSAPRLNILITAIGVSLLLQNVGQQGWMFGTAPKAMPGLIGGEPLASLRPAGSANAVNIVPVDVAIVCTAAGLMVGLQVLVFRTKLGAAMRAVSSSFSNASLMGINVNFVVAFTFVLGASLAAAAGVLYALKYVKVPQTADTTWVMLGLTAFVAAVVGGIGNLRGAVLGGYLIAGVQQFGSYYISSDLRDVFVFAALIVVLLVKPEGLLGSPVREKV